MQDVPTERGQNVCLKSMPDDKTTDFGISDGGPHSVSRDRVQQILSIGSEMDC